MAPLLLGLLGAGLGAGKHVLVDQPGAERDRKFAAETARWSPWTGINPQSVKIRDANMLGSVLKGGALGAMGGAMMSPAAAPLAMSAPQAATTVIPSAASALPAAQLGASVAPSWGAMTPSFLGGGASAAPSLMAGQAAPAALSGLGKNALLAQGIKQPSMWDKLSSSVLDPENQKYLGSLAL